MADEEANLSLLSPGTPTEDMLETPPEAADDAANAIRIIVADSEPIYRIGVRKIVGVEDDIRIVAQAESAEGALSAVGRIQADVMLLGAGLAESSAMMVSGILGIAPLLKIILVMTELTEEETVELMRRGVCGIVTRSIAPDLLMRCLRKVNAGETWLDNRGVSWVIEAYRAQATQLMTPPDRVRLSPKEQQIISGVTQGLRNKEIAQAVGTTEQVVKNYLRKVYDKLGVSDRLELALYCMHHHLLETGAKPEAGPRLVSKPSQAPVLTGAGRGEV
jgi:DNA-binding NarL/FixJ family response regulator